MCVSLNTHFLIVGSQIIGRLTERIVFKLWDYKQTIDAGIINEGISDCEKEQHPIVDTVIAS